MDGSCSDVALCLVKKYPSLLTEQDCINSRTVIQTLAARPDLFQSGSELGYWKRIIYSWIPVAGIHGFFWRLLQYFGLVWHDIDGFQWFLDAIINRQEKVYNLLKQMVGHKMDIKAADDGSGNNLLHFAGKLAPPHCLNKHTGAALQLRCELQWFMEIENFVEPTQRQAENRDKMTPRMVFTTEHKELIIEAREWMKNASSSATVVSALIFTIAFEAIFTAPGGNDPHGNSLLLDDPVFILFAISDAIALFSASTSVLMFLALLNSRFAEEDFLYAWPNRLLLGLVALSISIAATMVAFGSTLALLLRHKIKWIAAPVTFLAVIPVISFLSLKYPLLVELFSSVYGRGIFYSHVLLTPYWIKEYAY